MTEPTTPLPESPFCRVRARVASIWADGPDAGTSPDWRPAVGEKVTLTPSIGAQLLVYDVAGPEPIIVTVERVQCEVDVDGWLVKADGRPVYIAPTDDPLLSVTGWTWTATIKGKSIPFPAPAGGIVNLALFIDDLAVDATERISVVQIVADYITANPPDVAQAVADYLTANPPAAAPDATTAAKGLVRLAGDLGGTADAPTVPGLADKADTGHKHTLADVTDYTPPDLSGYATTAALASGLAGKADDGHGHAIGDVTGLQTALDGKQAAGSYAAATHTHTASQVSDSTETGRSVLTAADAAAARAAIGAGTSNLALGTTASTAKAGNYAPPSASTTVQGVVELATTAEATTGTDTTRAVTPAGVAAAVAGVGGGVTDHGALSGLDDDDHPQYALADGTRGAFAPPLGADDNYVTDAEKAALHSHANKTALDAVSGVNTGDQDLSGYATTTALNDGLADKADATHSHTLADVTDYEAPDLSSYATTASLADVATSGAYADLSGAPAIPDSPDDIGAAPATHDHTAADIDSGAALDGHVLTADGAGGAAWEAPPAGGGGGSVADPQPINAQTGAYTLTASDAGKLVSVTAATAVDVTVPSGVFTAGQRVDVLDLGAERVTFVAGTGMTLDGTPTLVSRAQYSAHSVVFLSASQAVVVGDLGAA